MGYYTETITYTPTAHPTWQQKINPIWWFGNATEQTVDQAPWFMPGMWEWVRVVLWGIRNPLVNFRCFVIGVADRSFQVTGRGPVATVQRNDLVPPETGWQWCYLHGIDLWFPLPFVSYSGTKVTWYAGWQPTGIAGVKFVLTSMEHK